MHKQIMAWVSHILIHLELNFAPNGITMSATVNYNTGSKGNIQSLGAMIPEQLSDETFHALKKLREALGGDVAGFVANRLRFTPEELSMALASEQIDGVALAIYNIEARTQSLVIGDQTGIGKGRQAAAMIRYGMLAGYLPIFLTDRYTLFSDMYRDCKSLGIEKARPLILNQKVSVVDFDKIVEDEVAPSMDEIWDPNAEEEEEMMGIYQHQYEEVYKSPKKSELELMYQCGDIPGNRFEYMMLTYSQLKDARKDKTRLDFISSLCEKHRVLFIFDEAHKSSSVSAGKISIITQSINAILEESPQTQCVFLSATFAKRPECLITFMRQTVLSSLATNSTLQLAFANGGVPMQEYVASILAKEGQMIRREHSNQGLPEPTYTYLDEELPVHSELFDRVMYWFRELVKLSDMVKSFMTTASLLGIDVFKPYPTRAQLFYVNKVLLLSLKAKNVAEAAVREIRSGRSVVIGLSDTLECVLHDSIDPETGECGNGDFSTLLLRLLDKTLRSPKMPVLTVFDIDFNDLPDSAELQMKVEELRAYSEQIRSGIKEEIFHLPMSPIDVIRQLITQEKFTDSKGIIRNVRFEECTGRARQLEYLSPEGDDEFVNATVVPRKKRHSNHIFNDFQNNKLDVILINACGATGASAHAIATNEVEVSEVRQRKMLIVQNDLDVNIDLQKRGRINRTGQVAELPPLYEYIITAIPSEKRLNMMLRAKLRSLSANTTANQDQDKRQADFTDITNKYGNLVTQEFLSNNRELAFILGLDGCSITASQLLARVAMLSVSAQQEIIDELFSAYQNLEQELRRINQWDLEREYCDFEAEFVKEELFTSSVDDTSLGGASMLSTFRCRHRTFPYDSKTLQQEIEKGKCAYGENLADSDELNKEIRDYYRLENKKIHLKFKVKREKLWDSTLVLIMKYMQDEEQAKRLMLLAQNSVELWLGDINKDLDGSSKAEKIRRKLQAYSAEFQDLNVRKNRELKAKSEQRKRLMDVLSMTIIGQAYDNILSVFPVEENIGRVMAVLKEVRFDNNPKSRFLPGKIQYIFALSAVRKELVLNLVDKGSHNNYGRLNDLLHLSRCAFNALKWDNEISKYNNRILERKIITGNILGAFVNPLIEKVKPRFITFSLSPDKEGKIRIERGLLLPMSGVNIEKILSSVALPLGEGLKYANSVNHVYQISGIGINFSIIPSEDKSGKGLVFYIHVDEKDSRKFESDARFDIIHQYFKATPVTSILNKNKAIPKRQLMHYATEGLTAESVGFNEVISLLVKLKATIMIPREYMTVGEMKGYAQKRTNDMNSNWPELDWWKSAIIPPVRNEVQLRISTPFVKDFNKKYVDEYSPHVLLCRHTLSYNGRSFNENTTIPGQIRALYFEWINNQKQVVDKYSSQWCGISCQIANDIHRILVNSSKYPIIRFDDFVLKLLQDEVSREELSSIGKIIERYRKEMLFLSPPKNIAEKFLDSCLCDPRLDVIRRSLEDYISGKTDIITDL